MIDTEAGLSVQDKAMKVKWCGLLSLSSSEPSSPIPSSHRIEQLDKTDARPIPEAYIYLLGVHCPVSIYNGLS